MTGTKRHALLAGDAGGTKTSLAIYVSVDSLDAPLAEGTFPSASYDSLEALIAQFLAAHDIAVDRACLGVAGPVIDGTARITNLPWVIAENRLAESLGLSSVRLINDLAAVATAVPHYDDAHLHTLQAGRAMTGGTIAVVAPGTGIGEAYLTWDGQQYRAHASEGGHADFAPTDERQRELLGWLQERFGHVSVERVASGSGIPNIYEFLKDTGRADEPEWLARQLAAAADPTPVIVNTAVDRERTCDICRATLEIFIAALGAETSNLALKLLATGGVYLGGGIPPRILPALTDGRFLEAFNRKGRFVELLTRMPVHVILDFKAALLGAARHGFAGE
ncbi:MAG TPA: glucokinase [Acidobacteriota bacterium]|nr:glucokinase [Acidobacteriota bacterium]